MVLTSAIMLAQKTTVSGTVIDGTTSQPVSGVSITAEGTSVVTNEDGFFTLKSEKVLPAIVVSHVGYRSQRVALDGRPTENLKIRLMPTVVQLNEVVVTADNARELVMAAIKRIPKNYSQTPELYKCFYRETAMKRQHYICVAEGVVDMYKSSYKYGDGRDKVAIYKGRRLLSPKRSDTLSIKVLGGPVAPIQLDVVKSADLLLNAEELDCYDLRLESPTTIGDRRQYVISLAPRALKPFK